MKNDNLALINLSVLPQVFSLVLSAKKLLASGEAKNTSDAARKVGISRSAFYKYKDYVFAYDEQHVINLKAELKDEAGCLSEFLSVLYKEEANILTVNQGIPSDKVAAVSVSIRIDTESHPIGDVIEKLNNLAGVVSVSRIM